MQHRSGFTIVEIIVVITAIAILTAIATVSYSGLQVRARDDERQADVDTIAAALETYHEQTGKYPDQATLTGGTFVDTSLRIPSAALTAPNATSTSAPLYSFGWGTSATISQYRYVAYRDTGTSNTCTLASQTCTRFVLHYNLEQDGAKSLTSKFGN